jgi:hypothetical protein
MRYHRLRRAVPKPRYARRSTSESRRMPSGLPLEADAMEMHEGVIEQLETILQTLKSE